MKIRMLVWRHYKCRLEYFFYHDEFLTFVLFLKISQLNWCAPYITSGKSPFTLTGTTAVLHCTTMSESSNLELKFPPCKVCAGKSSGRHFGVIACEACKVITDTYDKHIFQYLFIKLYSRWVSTNSIAILLLLCKFTAHWGSIISGQKLLHNSSKSLVNLGFQKRK